MFNNNSNNNMFTILILKYDNFINVVYLNLINKNYLSNNMIYYTYY